MKKTELQDLKKKLCYKKANVFEVRTKKDEKAIEKAKQKKFRKNILTILLIRTIVWLLVGEQILFQVGKSSQLSKTSKISREKITCKGGMIG